MNQPTGRHKLIGQWTEKFYESGRVTYEIAGKTAIFSEPTTSCGGEKISMEIPSHGAMVGITKGIFWKPVINWHIDRVRVMNPIRTVSEGQKLLGLDGRTERAFYTYLSDVRYQVEAHFEFNRLRPQFRKEWGNPKKYYCEMVKAILKEGRYTPFLGKSECTPTYIRLCDFGEGEGYYDHDGVRRFGYMFWGLTYPEEGYDEESRHAIMDHIWDAAMENGIITYPHPSRCPRRKIRDEEMKFFPDRDAERRKRDAGVEGPA